MAAPPLSREQIDEALADLDRLSRDEYERGIDALLADPDRAMASLRLRRLTGILLKRAFADAVPIDQPGETRSKRAWNWDVQRFDDPRLAGTPEFEILDELRRDLPRQHGGAGTWEATFGDLTIEADHERGLFKVFALWLDDRLNRQAGRSFKEYFEADESPRFEAALDASTTAAIAALGPVLATLVPIPAVVVSLVLIGVKFGYRSITDAAERGDADTHA